MAPSDRGSSNWLAALIAALRLGALRLVVRLFAWRLDADLAAGANPQGNRRLGIRAAELDGRRHRRRLAISLLRIVNEPRPGRPARLSTAIPVRRDQVADASEALTFLAQALLFADHVNARGVALLDQLVRDGGSVLYVSAEPGALKGRLETILHHLVASTDAVSATSASLPALPRGGRVGSR
jgi:hypothetical protein